MKSKLYKRMAWMPLCILSLASFSSHAKDYRISSVDEFYAVQEKVQPGDAVLFQAGEWKDAVLKFSAIGEENAPIEFKAEEAGSVVFSGNSYFEIDGQWLHLSDFTFKNGMVPKGKHAIVSFRTSKKKSASNCRLSHSFFDAYNAETPSRKYAWVRLYGMHNRVDHCLFKDHAHKGVTVQVMLKQDKAAHRIDHNYFLNRPEGVEKNGFETVQIAQGEDSMKSGLCVVEYNLFEACDAETEIISNKACDNIIQFNNFIACSGAVTLRHGDRGILRHNVFLGEGKPSSGGVRVVGYDHIIEDNYFSGLTGRTGGVISCYPGIPDSGLKGYFPASGTIIKNNLFDQNEATAINLNAGYGRNNRILRPENVIIEGNWISTTTSADVAFQAAPGIISKSEGNMIQDAVEIGTDIGNVARGKWTYATSEDGLIYPESAKVGDEMLKSPFEDSKCFLINKKDVGPEWMSSCSVEDSELLFYNSSVLDEIKNGELKAEELGYSIEELLKKSDEIIAKQTLYSVTFNQRTPPSGDLRDYYSTGPYWWPNPETENGLPYIRRDGEFNPERDLVSDRQPMHDMVAEVQKLALSYYFTEDAKYADWAVELLYTWFLDEKTGMRPNMNHAQAIPGKVDGRGTGIIDTLKFTELVDSLVLLKKSSSWETRDMDRMEPWFEEFLSWLLIHPYGIKEFKAKNNHGTAFDLQAIAIARYLGKDKLCDSIYQNSLRDRMLKQIKEDGRQPLELKRTRAWSYSTENLHHFYRMALLASKSDKNLFAESSEAGKLLKTALQYVLPYVGNSEDWPYEQQTEFQVDYIVPVLEWAAYYYDDASYLDAQKKIPVSYHNFMAKIMSPSFRF